MYCLPQACLAFAFTHAPIPLPPFTQTFSTVKKAPTKGPQAFKTFAENLIELEHYKIVDGTLFVEGVDLVKTGVSQHAQTTLQLLCTCLFPSLFLRHGGSLGD